MKSLMVLLLLTGCAWNSDWNLAHTLVDPGYYYAKRFGSDLEFPADVRVNIHSVSLQKAIDECGHTAACYDEYGVIWMNGYKPGIYQKHIHFEKIGFTEVSKLCGNTAGCWRDSTLYFTEFSINDLDKCAYIGGAVAEAMGLTPKNSYNAERTLGHEVFHSMGYPDIDTVATRWGGL